MNIALIGSGGREHAICEKIFLSKETNKIYCIPGNAGTARIAQNVDLGIEDFSKLYNYLRSKKINLVIVGPEEPLVKGLADYLIKKKNKGFWTKQICIKIRGFKSFHETSLQGK